LKNVILNIDEMNVGGRKMNVTNARVFNAVLSDIIAWEIFTDKLVSC